PFHVRLPCQSLFHTPPAWFSPPLAPSNVSGCRPKAVNPLHSAWGMTAGLPTARRSLRERRGGRISSPRAQRSNYKPNKSNLCVAKKQHISPNMAGPWAPGGRVRNLRVRFFHLAAVRPLALLSLPFQHPRYEPLAT